MQPLWENCIFMMLIKISQKLSQSFHLIQFRSSIGLAFDQCQAITHQFDNAYIHLCIIKISLGFNKLTHWPLGDEIWLYLKLLISNLENFLWNCPQVNATSHQGWLVNTGSGNGLVPSGNNSSHYLSQCWPRSMSSYGITRSEWVNKAMH